MKTFQKFVSIAIGCLFLSVLTEGARPLCRAQTKVDFNTQIKPIFADKCLHCHGPDTENQDSDFRVDSKESLFGDLGGYRAIVPGDKEASELLSRIHSEDDPMPPEDSNRTLSKKEKLLIEQWIQQGAPYSTHWAFELPEKKVVPREYLERVGRQNGWKASTIKSWSKNPIDVFVARKLLQNQLKPSEEDQLENLKRRVSLTTTGLLPTKKHSSKLASQHPKEAYHRYVDRLLKSMDYAERQSLRWLDSARYADTDGYQNDDGRTNWPWRDWVTKSFYENKPFDEFTIEQLAGDMLPNPTHEQILATAFNRNHRQNNEGGALAAEFLVENVIDRVETTSTVWLGLTMGCSRCHDHKFDPISQKEFYQFYGYFNNIGEKGKARGIQATPTIKATSPLKQTLLDTELARIQTAERKLDAVKTDLKKQFSNWFDRRKEQIRILEGKWSELAIDQAKLNGKGSLKVNQEKFVEYRGKNNKPAHFDLKLSVTGKKIQAIKLVSFVDKSFGRPVALAPNNNGNWVLNSLSLHYKEKRLKIQAVDASHAQDGLPAIHAIDSDPASGWGVFQKKSENVEAVFHLDQPLVLKKPGVLRLRLSFTNQHSNHIIGKLKVYCNESESTKDEMQWNTHDTIVKRFPERKLFQKKQETLLPSERDRLEKVQAGQSIRLLNAQLQVEAVKRQVYAKHGPVTVMVMKERKGEPAPSYFLNRGQYDQPDKSQKLSRGIPNFLLGNGASKIDVKDDQALGEKTGQPKNRLELAKWLVSRENPLTSRVIVNRIWQEHFGTGLVKTAEDFGVQGSPPSHPELLDWLAVEFMDSGWDVRAMHRLIVTSQTYRQSSKVSKESLQKDPTNHLFSRGPRFRADGFTIRDIALQAAGTLVKKAGGPPVKPYQPDGLWESVAANKGTRYRPGKGEDLYRKSMYTYWKRAVNPPRQTIFDSGGREVCNVNTRRTNTPLQALVLMNDPTFVESALKLALRVIDHGKSSKVNSDPAAAQIRKMYRLAIGRSASSKTLQILQDSHRFYLQHFSENPKEATKLLKGFIPSKKSGFSGDAKLAENAALMAVAHIILNLDEFVTIE